MAMPGRRPHVISNFVTSLDGIVSLQDRMVMGLLRSVCDVVLIGAGTLHADPDHFWTADGIGPELGDDFGAMTLPAGADHLASRMRHCSLSSRAAVRSICRFRCFHRIAYER
jgi:hypothetical protein